MLSFKACKEILNKNDEKYTDEEIIQIRDLLYQWIEIGYYHNVSKEATKDTDNRVSKNTIKFEENT